MNIILLRKDEVGDGTVRFHKTDARFQHIKKVLKLHTGSAFKAGIINGKKGTAVIRDFSEEQLTARFTAGDADMDAQQRPLPHIRLILGFPRPIQLRRILRDSMGLGIEALYLIGTELGEKSYQQADIAAPSEIERLLIEGACQAGDTMIPEVYRAHSLRHFFTRYGESIRREHTRAVLDVPPVASCPLTALSWQGCEPLWLAVGSERGWSQTERSIFTEQQFCAYTMGQRILRTETAVAAALAVSLANSGAWEMPR
ncbi:MAG: RsmE family RNA methyltransferase [Treponema sp.]|uniref:RsmE family RNA methyltransferase n=1 Tax=Treponema sp. TaxID=166 RepID=UPI003FA2CF73